MMITIPGSLPSINYLLRSPDFWGLYNAFVGVVAKDVKDRYEPIRDYPVSIHCTWYRKDDKADHDNIASAKKIAIDGLVKAGILEDDDPAHIGDLSDAFYVDDNPRVVVRITHSPAPGRWVWQVSA